MSSKLHRGAGVSAEPIVWRRVPALDALPPDAQPYSGDALGLIPASEPGARSSSLGRDVEQRTRAAYQQGVQEGQASARQEMATQVDAMNGRLARSIEELSGLRRRYRHEAEEDVVALALAIARRVLHRELTVAPEALLGLVKAALEKMEVREVHRVRVRAQDAPLVEQHLEKMGLPRRVEVIADPGLERGAAILDSSHGTLDISVETQLSEIERGFADVVRRA